MDTLKLDAMKHVQLVTLATWLTVSSIVAQEVKITHEGYGLTVPPDIEVTQVKDQGKTGTCWSFSTTSFIESEALRLNKGKHDLSEMYFVRMVYPQKADNYVRRHGQSTFGAGGLSHDIMKATTLYGMLPEAAYTGRPTNDAQHNHAELHTLLNGMLKNVVENKGGTLNLNWRSAYAGVLDSYLGPVPPSFEYQGKSVTPRQFADEVLGFEPENYLELTSFTHHPFYQSFVLEIPDNWANAQYHNVPLDELIAVLDHALDSGYTVVWDGDVSEKEFSHKNGIAVVPEKSWSEKNAQERARSFMSYEPEKNVTQEMRQHAFDNYATTDDHLMHIVGKVQDQRGITYYLTKNSWGTESKLGGYLFMSEAYVRLKTVALMVHREGIQASIAKKLSLD